MQDYWRGAWCVNRKYAICMINPTSFPSLHWEKRYTQIGRTRIKAKSIGVSPIRVDKISIFQEDRQFFANIDA